ncbi:hypothetical protein GCG54_00008293 [Colletotrichum gloeosporioides]|uniref:Uncharacterized protein n=1 Tax=Colletotrichum gloeosporioides TaxID=474922 RepID=A0A8H4C7R2_COLGL|nr:uncharacterized protein GCG54_00008293 [Colletotrichum gloeosporioides]KAF3798835.1 hypothetical protein GCG54_00008293 [Colletotrichum gloeosporioides]
MSTNESAEAWLTATKKAKAAFPEADTNTTPTVYDPSPIPREPISARAKERLRRDVDTWSADVTDRSQKIEQCPVPKKVHGPSSLMQEVVRDMRSPLCPPPNGLLSNLTSSSSGESTESSHSSSSYNFSQFETSSEVLQTRQMDKCFADANFEGQKMSAGEAFRTCLAHQNAGLQRADNLILRLRSELGSQYTERELAVQAQRQRRKRLEEFFDDITISAKENPDRLVDEIQDWRKAMYEYDVIERANDRTHEVGALLNDARDWRG